MARLRILVVAQETDGDVYALATCKFYQPGTATASGSSTSGTPFSGNLYAAIAGGSPISTTQTLGSNGTLTVWTDSKSRVDVGIEPAGGGTAFVRQYEAAEFDPADVATLTGTETLTNKTIASPDITGSLVGKLGLTTNSAVRALESLQVVLGNTGWGSAGGNVHDASQVALSEGSTSPTLTRAKPQVLVERHIKPQTLDAEGNEPVDSFRIQTKIYDGAADSGYHTSRLVQGIHSVIHSYSDQDGFAGSGVPGHFGTNISGLSSHVYAYGDYVVPYGAYLNAFLQNASMLAFGAEVNTYNASGVAAPIWRKSSFGTREGTQGATIGLNVGNTASGGGTYGTAALLVNSASATSAWRTGIVFNLSSINSEAIDMSLLGPSVVPIILNNSGAISAAKEEGNAGTTTSATATSLTCLSASWETDIIGQTVYISGGTGAGQLRTISARPSGTEVTISSAWDITPDATSTFLISRPTTKVLEVETDNTLRIYNNLAIDFYTDSPVLHFGRFAYAAWTLPVAGQKIKGDFSHATLGNRVAFQTTTTNGDTNVAAIPAGTGTTGSFIAANNSTIASGQGLQLRGTTTSHRIASLDLGAGSVLPIGVYMAATKVLSFEINGDIVPGTGALATNATAGWLFLTSSAGTPTGVPTTYTGRVPVEIDTTNGRLYAYYGGAWHYVALT